MSGNMINVMDPEVWAQLPNATRISAINQIQNSVVIAALKAGGMGDFLLETRALEGEAKVDLSYYCVIVAHKSDPIVPEEVRSKMGRDQKLWVKLINLTEELPKGTESFAAQMKLARENAPKGDLWSVYCNDGQAFIGPISLDKYVEYTTPPPPQPDPPPPGVIDSTGEISPDVSGDPPPAAA